MCFSNSFFIRLNLVSFFPLLKKRREMYFKTTFCFAKWFYHPLVSPYVKGYFSLLENFGPIPSFVKFLFPLSRKRKRKRNNHEEKSLFPVKRRRKEKEFPKTCSHCFPYSTSGARFPGNS